MCYKDEDFDKAAFMTERIGAEDLCNAKLKDATEKQSLTDTESYALNITKDLQDMGITSTQMMEFTSGKKSESIPSVSVVTEKSEKMGHLDSATNITRCTEIMEMLCGLTEENDQQTTDITVLVKMGKQNTEKYMRIISEGNLNLMRWFTILIVLGRITASKTFTSSVLKVNIPEFTVSFEQYGEDMVMMLPRNLWMDIISTRVSNSNLYKEAGNGICVCCLEAILSQLIPGKENDWKERYK